MAGNVEVTGLDDKTQVIYAKSVQKDGQGTTVEDLNGYTKFFPHATTKQVAMHESLNK